MIQDRGEVAQDAAGAPVRRHLIHADAAATTEGEQAGVSAAGIGAPDALPRVPATRRSITAHIWDAVRASASRISTFTARSYAASQDVGDDASGSTGEVRDMEAPHERQLAHEVAAATWKRPSRIPTHRYSASQDAGDDGSGSTEEVRDMEAPESQPLHEDVEAICIRPPRRFRQEVESSDEDISFFSDVIPPLITDENLYADGGGGGGSGGSSIRRQESSDAANPPFATPASAAVAVSASSLSEPTSATIAPAPNDAVALTRAHATVAPHVNAAEAAQELQRQAEELGIHLEAPREDGRHKKARSFDDEEGVEATGSNAEGTTSSQTPAPKGNTSAAQSKSSGASSGHLDEASLTVSSARPSDTNADMGALNQDTDSSSAFTEMIEIILSIISSIQSASIKASFEARFKTFIEWLQAQQAQLEGPHCLAADLKMFDFNSSASSTEVPNKLEYTAKASSDYSFTPLDGLSASAGGFMLTVPEPYIMLAGNNATGHE